MKNRWFESVAHMERRAKRRLPKPVYGAIVAGAESGLSARDNIAAFDEIGIVPHLTGAQQSVDLSTSIMGVSCSMPIVISPTGVQAVHPDGEVAVARAANERDVIMGVSSFASRSISDISHETDKFFYQIYWMQKRDDMLRWMERARDSGAKGLILTLDWSFSHGRDWGSPRIPERLTISEALRFAPHALARLPWLMEFAKARKLPDLRVPNVTNDLGETSTFFGAYGSWMQTERPSWQDIAWLRSQWEGPFMIKGVWNPEDAVNAVAAGATAISVSNHGGNNLDGIPSPLRVLPAVKQRVGDGTQVLLDGGVRRGSDVVKALALGADAVMIGRAYLWGLAAHGTAGIVNVLDLMRSGVEATLRGMGKSSLSELSPSDLLIPASFLQTPGSQNVSGP